MSNRPAKLIFQNCAPTDFEDACRAARWGLEELEGVSGIIVFGRIRDLGGRAYFVRKNKASLTVWKDEQPGDAG